MNTELGIAWQEITDECQPVGPIALFAYKTDLSLDGSGWNYQLGIFNEVVKKWMNRGCELSFGQNSNSHFLQLRPPTEKTVGE